MLIYLFCCFLNLRLSLKYHLLRMVKSKVEANSFAQFGLRCSVIVTSERTELTVIYGIC